MKKQVRIFWRIVGILYCLNSNVFGQSGDSSIIVCPVNAAFTRYSGGTTNSVPTQQSAFTQSAIVTCGNFRIYYEDMQQNTGEGFDDPSVGLARRNTICAALGYIQSVLNITVTIDLYMELSLTPVNNPANNVSINWSAVAGPNFKPGTFGAVAGYFGGNFYDHVMTGIDPDVNDFDAHITFNFHQTWTQTSNPTTVPVVWWDDYQVTTPSCKLDLFSIALHEFTHCLGFMSALGDDGTSNHYLTNKSGFANSFTKLDEHFLWYGDPRSSASFFGNKLVTGTSTPSINSAFASMTNFLYNFTPTISSNSVWMTNNIAPNNYKSYDGYWYRNATSGSSAWQLTASSMLSHLDRAYIAAYRAGQYSPGFQPRYVMGHSTAQNEIIREWTLQEIRILMTLGYNLSSAFAGSSSLSSGAMTNLNLLNLNSPPIRSNYATVDFVKFPLTMPTASLTDFGAMLAYPETKQATYTLTNTNFPGSTPVPLLTINTYTMVDISDPDLDLIGVFPNSLYGIKGVTTGGNNHNSIVLTNTHTIVYTPPPGFYGRAEFGFNLWDGKEKGAFTTIVIEVLPGSFTVTPGNELVINGGFEDATEVKTASNPNAAIATRINNQVTELNYGAHQSGGHPYVAFSLYGNDDFSGIIRKESYRYCWLSPNAPPPSIFPDGYGWPNLSCDQSPIQLIPNSAAMPLGTNNECYAVVNGQSYLSPVVSTLMNPLQSCKYYTLEFDATQSSAYSIGSVMSCSLLAVSNLSYTVPFYPVLTYSILQSIPIDYTVTAITISSTNYSWQHIKKDFFYCSAPTRSILISAGSAANFGIDNISLKENLSPPPPLVVTATNANTVFCPGSTTTLTGKALNSSCATTFTWLPMNIVSPTVQVTPSSTTSYTLKANDGCRTGSAIITPSALPVGIFTAPPLCIGNISPSLFSLLPSTVATTGTFTGASIIYSLGIPYIDLRPTAPNYSLLTGGTNNYTYAITYTNGCSQVYNISVLFLATPTIVTTAPCNPGQTLTLSVLGNTATALTYTWLPGNLSGQTVTVNPTVNTTYTVVSSNIVCANTATLAVIIPTITFQNLPTSLCTMNQWLYLGPTLAPGTPTNGTWSASVPPTYTVSLTIVQSPPPAQVYAQYSVVPGTYTLTYTYSTSTCYHSNQFTINVFTTPTVSTNGPLSLCTNISSQNSTTLISTSTSSLPMSYTWMPGSLVGNSLVVTPTISTVYTVTGSNGTCTATPALLEVYGNSLCCGGTSTATPYTYLTNTSIGSATLNGLYAINQNITITGTVSLYGEYYFAPNVGITVNGGFLNTDAIVSTPDGTTTSRAHLRSCYDMWNGIQVTNWGKVKFDDRDLIEDAKVAISSNNSVNNSYWPADYEIQLDHVVFNRNRIAVSIKNYTQTTNPMSAFYMTSCIFTSRTFTYLPLTNAYIPIWPYYSNLSGTTTPVNPLGSPYLLANYPSANLKTPYSSDPPYAGVYVENSGITSNPTTTNTSYYSITIGDGTNSTASQNIFDNLHTGINFLNSNVNSSANIFQSSRMYTLNPNVYFGAGIKGENNLLNSNNYNSIIRTEGLVNPSININRFYDCHIGLEAKNIFQINMKYAEVRSTQSYTAPYSSSAKGQYGVLITSNVFKDYSIYGNKFLNLNVGVSLVSQVGNFNVNNSFNQGQVWGSVNIGYNLFSSAATLGGSPGTGYMNVGVVANNVLYSRTPPVLGAGFYTVAPYNAFRVQNNTFDQVYRGVLVTNFLNSAFGKYTTNNTFTLTQDYASISPMYGVEYDNNNFGVVNSNTVIGFTSNATSSLTGIYFSMNKNSQMECNSVISLAKGITFASQNSGTTWKGNTMQINGRGMQLASNGIIGAQGSFNVPSDNYWPGSWASNSQTYVDQSSSATTSTLYVRSLGGYSPTINGGTGTIYSSANSSLKPGNVSATWPTCVPMTGTTKGPYPSKTQLAKAIIGGTMPYGGTYTSESAEIGRILLFEDLDDDTALVNSDPVIQGFYNSNQARNLGKMTQISQLLSKGDYTNATIALAAFSDSTTIQLNYKKFFNFYLKSLEISSKLTSTDSSDLNTLAHKCPFVDGPVVYLARTLNRIVKRQVEMYNDNACDNNGMNFLEYTPEEESRLLYAMQANDPNNSRTFELFPNPAIDKLSISAPFENGNLEVIIKDVTNKLLVKTNVVVVNYGSELKFDLLNGIYFISLVKSNGETFTKKLIIAK